MALHFLDLNESKTEVKMFRPNSASRPPCIGLASLALFEKATTLNLGVRMDQTRKVLFFPAEVAVKNSKKTKQNSDPCFYNYSP